MNQILLTSCVLDPLWTFITGSVFATVITLFVTWKRDKGSRKRRFCAFLSLWKANQSAQDRGPTTANASTAKDILIFDEMVSQFQPEIEHVRDIWGSNKEFIRLCSELAALNHKNWNNRQPKDVICRDLYTKLP